MRSGCGEQAFRITYQRCIEHDFRTRSLQTPHIQGTSMRITTVLLLGCVLAGSTASTAALAASITRGKSLYETKCHACHDRSVHNRKARKAKSFEAIRKEVVRWDDALGGGWTKEDVDDVTVYLNETYYRFRCPESMCTQQQSLR